MESMDDRDLLPPPEAQRWTKAETYVVGLARQRSAVRRRLGLQPRSEPERPQLMLSTVPFAALLGILAMLFFVIAIQAWPRSTAPERGQAGAAQPELGTAAKGWLQEAEKEFPKAPPGERRG